MCPCPSVISCFIKKSEVGIDHKKICSLLPKEIKKKLIMVGIKLCERYLVHFTLMGIF